MKTEKMWIEKRTEDDETFEVLMEKCSCCGQPLIRSRILRMSKADIKQWERFHYSGRGFGLWVLLAAAASVAGGVFVLNLSYSLFRAGFALFGLYLSVGVLPALLYYGRKERIAREAQKAILSRYANFKLEEVSTSIEDGKKHLILSEGQDPA